MKIEELPRGISRRGDSLVVTFALRDAHCSDSEHVADCICGRIERRSLGECTVTYAINRLREFKNQMREGTYEKRARLPERKREVVVLVGDLLESYLRNYRNRGKRAESRQLIAWQRLKSTFGSIPVDKLTTDAIEKYVEARRAGIVGEMALLSRNGTINRELSLLKAMLTHGTKVTPPRVASVPAFPDRLEESEPRQGFIEDAAYSVLASNAASLWLRTLLACAYSFGFRKNELLNLRVEQVDLIDRTITLERRQTKANVARRIFLTEETFRLLAACVTGKKLKDFVLTRANGEKVCEPRDEWAAMCVASGLGHWTKTEGCNGKEYWAYSGLTLHDLRRSAIRRMVRSGITETVAMKISGHSTRKVFDTYDISSDADKREAARKIERGPATIQQPSTDTKTLTSGPDLSEQTSQLPHM